MWVQNHSFTPLDNNPLEARGKANIIKNKVKKTYIFINDFEGYFKACTFGGYLKYEYLLITRNNKSVNNAEIGKEGGGEGHAILLPIYILFYADIQYIQ